MGWRLAALSMSAWFVAAGEVGRSRCPSPHDVTGRPFRFDDPVYHPCWIRTRHKKPPLSSHLQQPHLPRTRHMLSGSIGRASRYVRVSAGLGGALTIRRALAAFP